MDAKTLCLGVLTLGEASGYEIRKMFTEGPFSAFQDISFGSIYPALGQLKDQALIEVRDPIGDDRADKKIYRLTDKGRDAFAAALDSVPGPDKVRSDAIFMLFFSDLMSATERETLFDAYLETHKDRLALMQSTAPHWPDPGRLFVRGLGEAYSQAIVTYMETNKQAFRAGDPPAAHADLPSDGPGSQAAE